MASTTTMSVRMSASEDSVATSNMPVIQINPSDRSLSQLDLDSSIRTVDNSDSFRRVDNIDGSCRVDNVDSFCSLTSSVIGPQTYRPPTTNEEDGEYAAEDLDLRIKDIKCKIETEMKENRRRPPGRPNPPPFVHPMMPGASDPRLMPPPPHPILPMHVDVEVPPLIEHEPNVPVSDPTVVLDPASGRVVPIASLSWHQRYALTHPYFRNLPYLPPPTPFLMPQQPPSAQAGFAQFRRRLRSAPLVRYIPGGYKDINRQSSFSPVDFSSELMSYVRMRKEMLKMDLREKIRLRKEDLIKSQKAVFEGGRGRDVGRSRHRHHDSDLSVRPSGKYAHYYREGRDRDVRGPRNTSPVAKTPRQVWQSRVKQRDSRSSSSSSSSSDDDDDDDDNNKNDKEDDSRVSRRKWIAERKAAMLAKTAAIKEKIKRERSMITTTAISGRNAREKTTTTTTTTTRNDKENGERNSPVVPNSYRYKNESPDRNAGRRSLKSRGLRESKNFRGH